MSLAHEIAGHNQFADYYANRVEGRLTERNKRKIYKEICCNYPSHKYNVDCPDQCEHKFMETIKTLDSQTLRKSATLKTIYLELLRDYEYEHKIEINDNNA